MPAPKHVYLRSAFALQAEPFIGNSSSPPPCLANRTNQGITDAGDSDVSAAMARAGARAARLSESEAATFCLQQMFCGSGCFFPSQDGLLAEQSSGRRL